MSESDLGTLTRHGERWRLTFIRRFAQPREKVWRAITEPEHLAVWFPDRIVGEFRAGAALRFVAAVHDDFDGEMTAFDPPSLMELTWGPDSIRIELEPDGDGTRLLLTDTFDERGKAARDGAGWHECVDRLACDLDGVAPPAWRSGWRARFDRYRAHLGPEASTIEPPESWEPASEARA